MKRLFINKRICKKVLMVCFVFPPRFSGAAQQALSLAKGLRMEGILCDFLVPNYENNTSYIQARVSENIDIYKVKGGQWLFSLSILIFLLFNSHRYKWVHFHGVFNGLFFAIFWAKLFRLKVIQKLTQGDDSQNELNQQGRLAIFRKVGFKLVDHFIAISSSLNQGLLKAGVKKNRVHMIPNSVDVDFYMPQKKDRNRHRKMYNFNFDDFILLNVGAIQKRKNQIELIHLLNLFRKLEPKTQSKVKLILSGPYIESTYLNQIHSTISSKGLSDCVLLTGMVSPSTLRKFYSMSDIMVFSGKNEGLPNVLLEAKSSGLPVVAFSAPGVEDIIRDGIDGFQIKYGDTNSFFKKIYKLYSDHSMRARFSEKARDDACKRYSLSKLVKRYAQEIYYK